MFNKFLHKKNGHIAILRWKYGRLYHCISNPSSRHIAKSPRSAAIASEIHDRTTMYGVQ